MCLGLHAGTIPVFGFRESRLDIDDRSICDRDVVSADILAPPLNEVQEMDIDALREYCMSFPAVTEDVKWGNDLCFSVANKMFCVAGLEGPMHISFKVKDDEFYEMSSSPGIRPAPYVARYKWVLVEKSAALSRKEWHHYIKQSYDLVRAKLPKKVAKQHGLL